MTTNSSRRAFVAGGAAVVVALTYRGKSVKLIGQAGAGMVRRPTLRAPTDASDLDPFYPYRNFGETHADFLRRAFRAARSIEIVNTLV